MTTFFVFYHCSVNHQSGLQSNAFSKLSYIFKTSKCAANYVISIEVYDGFIGQKMLKLWKQESWQFGPGWSPNITRIRLWNFASSACVVKSCLSKIFGLGLVVLFQYILQYDNCSNLFWINLVCIDHNLPQKYCTLKWL